MRPVPVIRILVGAAVLVLLGARTDLATPGTPAALSPAPMGATRILEMALASPRLIDYEGTKVIASLRGGRSETVTVAESHKRPDMTRLEYLSPEDVAGRLIVDNGSVAWHYEPRLNLAFEGPTMQSGLLSRDLTLLLRNYTIADRGLEDVIGRSAHVLILEPRGGGVRRQLWVDRATGTVLRSEERDPIRGVVLSTHFSRISFSLNLPEASFQFRKPGGARILTMFTTDADSMSPAALEDRVHFPVLIPPVLPEGYTFRGGAVSRFGSLTSVYLRYSDGGNLISFFEAPAGSIGWPAFGQPIRVGTQRGRFVDLGYFRVLIWEQRGLRVTAVGTIPTETLIQVAGQVVAGREQALVHDISQKIDVEPATVRQLRGEGLTFPEITRTVVLAQHLGTDLPTTVRFVRGTLNATDLAGRLGMRPEVLRRAVAEVFSHAQTIPALLPGSAR
jgi:outer membrane lipoprotein-sorting protein